MKGLIQALLVAVTIWRKVDCQSSSSIMNKIYSQSGMSTGNNRGGWPNPALSMSPMRNYQPAAAAAAPVPLHYFSRLLAPEPYYPNDYFYPPDAYPYPPSYEPDYYPNFYYYLPPNAPALQGYANRIPYVYDQTDNLYEDKDNQLKNWWQDQNESPITEDDYYEGVDDYDKYGADMTMANGNMNGRRLITYPDRRYEGIDGFGRKKERERIFGSRRESNRRDNNGRAKVYGVPLRALYKNEDEDVKELKSLREQQQLQPPMDKSTKINNNNNQQHPGVLKSVLNHRNPFSMPKQEVKSTPVNYLGPELAGWINGNVKRNSNSAAVVDSTTEIASVSSYPPEETDNDMRLFPQSERPEQNDYYYDTREYDKSASVFDTIKKLLAMEDKVNQQEQEENFEKNLYMSTNEIPDNNIEAIQKSRNRKRSVSEVEEQFVKSSDSQKSGSLNPTKESLTKELKALRQNIN